ncbi:glycosyltransferase family 2 protein [Geofilum rubicundum]|nr:glycosyltransferase [Geofilum rubicundum]
MTNKLLFSIGVPAFKAAFLKDCIQSILNQTYENFELIIVNDASPEDLETIVSFFNDDRIKYHCNEHNFGALNVVDNWNKCLSYAKGDYFVLMGDDDLMEPDYLINFKSLIEKYPQLNVFHCRSNIINESSELIGVTPSWPEYESLCENIWHRLFTNRVQYVSDFVYRTEVLRSNGGFFKQPLAWASDDITAYMMIDVYGIAHINRPLLNYRRNPKTISSTGNVNFKLMAIKNEISWIKEFVAGVKPIEKKEYLLASLIENNIAKYQIKKQAYTCVHFFSKGFLFGVIDLMRVKDIPLRVKILSIALVFKRN